MEQSIDNQLYTYEGRLATFQKNKKRASTTNGRGKALNWPHKSIAPEDLAKVGFYFHPSPENPDNVSCFICNKSMDGWEAGDDPLVEHINHASDCGWAIVCAVEAGIQGLNEEDPSAPDMIDARTATFAGLWPYESKRGWKCKTKQLVEAGWKYTPSLESDDMATCVYCQLSLDGWEKEDKPWDEHYRRAPGCPFFTLFSKFGPPKKRTARTKPNRTSKASRLSTQSIAPSETTVVDLTSTTVGPDDTVLTTVSSSAQGTKKPKGRKAAASKGKKTKTMPEDPPEEPAPEPEPEVEPEPVELVQPEAQVSPVPVAKQAPKNTRATRGKKRGSEVLEESNLTPEAPPPAKRRDTRSREESVDTFLTANEDTQMTIEPPVKKRVGRNVARKASATSKKKKTNLSNASRISSMSESTAMPADAFPDDDEIERQLQAELDRASDDGQPEGPGLSTDYAMFDPNPKEVDDTAVKDALEYLEAEMRTEKSRTQPQLEPEEAAQQQDAEPELTVPKKNRKAGTRKASKQSKPKKAVEPEPEEPIVIDSLPEDNLDPDLISEPQEAELAQDEEVSLGSTDTVVKKISTDMEVESEPEEVPEPEAEPEAPKRKRGRPSKASIESQRLSSLAGTNNVVKQPALKDEASKLPAEPQPKRKPGRPPKKSSLLEEDAPKVEDVEVVQQPVKRGRGRPPKVSNNPSNEAEIPKKEEATQGTETSQPPKKSRGRPPKASGASRTSVLEVAAKPAEEPVKRARGRPPKAASQEQMVLKKLEVEIRPEPIEEVEVKIPKSLQPSKRTEDVSDSDELASEDPPNTLAPEASRQGPILTTHHHNYSSPAMASRKAALSPSASLQSSDAENEPPSSKPSAHTTTTTKRIPLAPMATTPVQGSPSKRNIVAGLQSSTLWSSVDLDAVFGTPNRAGNKENNSKGSSAAVERFLRRGKELTSPEKGMTVEEWIHFNAEQAEKELRHECEAMVSRFENEGTRAMKVLEGLYVRE